MEPVVLLLVVLSVCMGVVTSGGFINEFAIRVDGGKQEAVKIARELGFDVVHELPHIQVFLLSHPLVKHRSKRSATHHLELLKAHPKVLYAQQEELLDRVKRYIIYDKQLEMPLRDIKDSEYHRVMSRITARSEDPNVVTMFIDPLYNDQWYLDNVGQSGGIEGVDLNVVPAWRKGFHGEGSNVCILDDGVDHQHEDLQSNYNPSLSMDLNDRRDLANDPQPNNTNPDVVNSHGTRCAGAVGAVANNEMCGVGVAYRIKLGGIRILDGHVTDAMEAEALGFKIQDVDIFSASWGPPDNGKVFDEPRKLAAEAMANGVKNGRNKLGVLYVWATGNGGQFDDNCNADGYVSAIESMSFGSVSDKGEKPYFMETCTSTLAVVPSGGEKYQGEEQDLDITKIKVVTTDIGNGCVENFQGTSSAAPLAAGCVALTLQANRNLDWRDMQHIVVHTSRIPNHDPDTWILNGAGFHVSPIYGFGVLDCSRMVALAQTWNRVGTQQICKYHRPSVERIIRSYQTVSDSVVVDNCQIQRLEHIQVQIRINFTTRGDVRIELESPSGTPSILLTRRSLDKSTKEIDFTFMSVHSWGENPLGTWHLFVVDANEDTTVRNSGVLFEWTLVLYGTAGENPNNVAPHVTPTGTADVIDNAEQLQVIRDAENEVSEHQVANMNPYVPADTTLRANNNIIKDLVRRFRNADLSRGSDWMLYKPGTREEKKHGSGYLVKRVLNKKEKKELRSTISDDKLNDVILDVLIDVAVRRLLHENSQEKSVKEKKEVKSSQDLDDDVMNAVIMGIINELKRAQEPDAKADRMTMEEREMEKKNLDDLIRTLGMKLQEDVKRQQESVPMSKEKLVDHLLEKVEKTLERKEKIAKKKAEEKLMQKEQEKRLAKKKKQREHLVDQLVDKLEKEVEQEHEQTAKKQAEKRLVQKEQEDQRIAKKQAEKRLVQKEQEDQRIAKKQAEKRLVQKQQEDQRIAKKQQQERFIDQLLERFEKELEQEQKKTTKEQQEQDHLVDELADK